MEHITILIHYDGPELYTLFTSGSEEDTLETLVQIVASHQLGDVKVDVDN